jgi:hypothetical protein
MNWLSLKMKPTRTADAKHAPGKDYSKRKEEAIVETLAAEKGPANEPKTS